ncbi:hypothetical protein WK91_34525 [Burkholderia cepacia]|uniref:hypothetical protein n=1 Tax=Burkholderia cepacia TaxID=292 RepID=UPI0007551AA6|nr:hypothetical protein [Burkholderia cepacia]KVW05807.1 hypothetical protein WK91_34525 [Burkholderia cepacia]
MDQRTHEKINESNIDDVLKIVEQITTRKRPERKKTGIWARLENIQESVRVQALFGLVATLVLAILAWTFPSDPMLGALLVIGTVVCLMGTALLIFITINGMPLINEIRKTPFSPLLSNIRDAMALDLPLFNQLMLCDRAALEFVLSQYRHERMAFERRGAMIAGQLDKIGLFPALAAFAVVATTVWKIPSPWAKELIFLIPAFYFMNFMGYGLTQEMDRVIGLIELVLSIQNDAAQE